MDSSRRKRVLEKVAGAGARVLKSFIRTQQRMAEAIAASSGKNPEKIFKRLIAKGGKTGLIHQSSYGGGTRKAGLKNVPKGGVTHFTTGGLFRPRADPTKTRTETIPFGDIRKMRGKFGIDTLAADLPTGQRGNAVIFRGNLRKAVRPHDPPEGSFQDRLKWPWLPPGKRPSLPRKLRYPQNVYGSPLKYPRGDAQIQAPWVKLRKPIVGDRHPTDEYILDAARPGASNQHVRFPRTLFKPLDPATLPKPVSTLTPGELAERLATARRNSAFRRIPRSGVM